jgi:hypothetical protein
MTDFPNFGEIPGHVTLYDVQRQAQQRAAYEAKRITLEKAELAVTDENGRHLSERKWRQRYDFIRGLFDEP